MKNIWQTLGGGAAVLCSLWFGGCKVDTLEEVKALEPRVSMVQTGAGQVSLKPEDIEADKTALLLRKTMGISYAGYAPNKTFNATLTLSFDQLPEGYEAFEDGECFITTTADGKVPAGSVEIAAGAKHSAFYFNITKAAIDAHAGKKVAAKITLGGLSMYELNPMASTVYLLMDMNDFAMRKVDVTAAYFKNANFTRAAGTTDRFAALGEWQANAAVMSSRPQGAGFDANANKMGIERWSGGDKGIINGKIYQTFTLPKGQFQVEMAMGTVIPDRDTYFVVAKGASLPDDAQVSSAIASLLITSALNNNTLVLPFINPESQQVTAGFLLNFDQGTQKVLQASSIKLYKLESLFD